MNPPDRELREWVSEQARSIRSETDQEADTKLANLIELIDHRLREEIEQGSQSLLEDGQSLAAACDAWASLVSHALAQVYAPMSPFPRNVGGWGQKAIQRVQHFAGTLRIPLSAAQQALQASSYSISVGFPWGISIGFTWP